MPVVADNHHISALRRAEQKGFYTLPKEVIFIDGIRQELATAHLNVRPSSIEIERQIRLIQRRRSNWVREHARAQSLRDAVADWSTDDVLEFAKERELEQQLSGLRRLIELIHSEKAGIAGEVEHAVSIDEIIHEHLRPAFFETLNAAKAHVAELDSIGNLKPEGYPFEQTIAILAERFHAIRLAQTKHLRAVTSKRPEVDTHDVLALFRNATVLWPQFRDPPFAMGDGSVIYPPPPWPEDAAELLIWIARHPNAECWMPTPSEQDAVARSWEKQHQATFSEQSETRAGEGAGGFAEPPVEYLPRPKERTFG